MEPQVIIASWCSSDLRGSTGALHLPAPKCRRPSEITEYINREPFKKKKKGVVGFINAVSGTGSPIQYV